MIVEDASEAVKSYIASHSVCHLALSENDSPSAYTVYYVSNGYSIYIESDSGSHKLQLLNANSKLSLTIDEDYATWRDIKGVQLFGKAEFVDEKGAESLKTAFERKFPWMLELGGIPSHHVFVRVIPEKIYFLDYSKGIGHRTVLHPEDMKKSKSNLTW